MPKRCGVDDLIRVLQKQGEEQEALSKQQSALIKQQEALSKQQIQLLQKQSVQQDALRKQQETLSKQQVALSKQQDALNKNHKEIARSFKRVFEKWNTKKAECDRELTVRDFRIGDIVKFKNPIFGQPRHGQVSKIGSFRITVETAPGITFVRAAKSLEMTK